MMRLAWQKLRGLGWLSFPAAVLVLLALVYLSWATPIFAQTWESYAESNHKTVWGTVTNPYDVTYQIVYMYGEGFVATTHNVGYYDNRGLLTGTESNVNAPAGKLSSQYNLGSNFNAQAGTWHASAYQTPTSPPATYDGSGIANDDFQVVASAIPEFPTILSAIAVAILCFTACVWMRKKTGYVPA